MRDIKKVLFPTDFSKSAETAADNAVAFAKKYNAELHIFHANLLFEGDVNDKDLDGVDDRLTAIGKRYAAAGLRLTLVEKRGISAASLIQEYVGENDINLVIMATHGRRGFKRWLLGSVAEEVVRIAGCPVLTMKETWQAGDLGNLSDILAPVDFSLASKAALKNAAYMAKLFDAQLHVLHVVQEAGYADMYGAHFQDLSEFQDKAVEKSREILRSLTEELNLQTRIHVIPGHPAHEIVKFAQATNINLIVMAHLGLSRLPDRILGSVTEHVVRSATCPVLTADLAGD